MPFTQDMLAELNVLMRFNLSSMQEGIKVHSNAEQAVIHATRRLYERGILTQADGGYLTDLGMEAADLAAKLFGIMSSSSAVTN